MQPYILPTNFFIIRIYLKNYLSQIFKMMIYKKLQLILKQTSIIEKNSNKPKQLF